MNIKNLVIICVMVSANFIFFFLGGYHTLFPIIFIIGLVGASVLSGWTSLHMKTKDLLVFMVIATIIATIDEYAHTSVGTLTYFDHAVPSPLTVFGWGLFMLLILTISRRIMQIQLFNIDNAKKIQTLPVLTSILLISISFVLQGYLTILNWLMVLVYLILSLASLYYSYNHSLKWNLSLMITSLIIGFTMEYAGAFEGLWTFHFIEPVSLFIVFSWPLRIWTVLAFCFVFNVELTQQKDQRALKDHAHVK